MTNLGDSLKGAINASNLTFFFLLFFFVYSVGRQFDFMESVVISVLLFLIVVFYWAQIGVIGKY